MQRVRIRKTARPRRDVPEILPTDPRDPDVARAKALAGSRPASRPGR